MSLSENKAHSKGSYSAAGINEIPAKEKNIPLDQLYQGDIPFILEIIPPSGRVIEAHDFLRVVNPETNNPGILEFRLTIKKGELYNGAFLHTDIQDGHWAEIPFTRIPVNGDNESEDYSFNLKIPMPPGGYFSFRFYLENVNKGGTIRYWEPCNYHRLLIDPPLVNNLRMYTLLPTVSGKIDEWTEELEHISSMGFNAVHILPFTAMGPSESPYSAANYFEIDSHYLSQEGNFKTFEKFTDRLKNLGMSLCFDIVLNHVSDASVLATSHGNWMVADPEREDGLKRAGCWHQGTWISWEDLVLINFDHPNPQIRQEIYNYMLEYVLFWIEKAKGCGALIRLDNLHSSNDVFMKWLLSELSKKVPEVPVLSEFFGSNEHLFQGVTEFGLNILTANTWESPFAPMLTDYIRNIHKEDNPVRYYLSPTSHDTETAAELFGTVDSSIPRYFVCALMGTGQTGIVQGFEYGWSRKINFIGRHKKGNFRGDRDFTNTITEINYLLDKEAAFLQKGIEFVDTGDDSLIAGFRVDPDSGKTLFLATNFNTTEDKYFQLKSCRSCTPLLTSGAEIIKDETTGEFHSIKFSPCGICVLRVNKKK
ncbi:MAG: hypothetical protein JEY99_13460 [Spirochaetales bacterium]|nr:hypothetical protein [Spirochaetales bacterium]